jgi:hypothetical protein
MQFDGRSCALPTFGQDMLPVWGGGQEEEVDDEKEAAETHLRALERRLKRLYPLQQVGCLVPTLYEPESSPLKYTPTCTAILSALHSEQGEYWKGRWDCNTLHLEGLLLAIKGVTGRLTIDRILKWGASEDNRETVLSMPGACHGLLNEQVVKETFALHNHKGKGSLSHSEWFQFMAMLEQVHISHLLTTALVENRAFFGRRYKWPFPSTALSNADLLEAAGDVRSASEVNSHWFMGYGEQKEYRRHVPDILQLPGDDAESVDSWADWFGDLYYYSANHHPLHGIFACDPANRLTKIERLAIEVGNFGILCLCYDLHSKWIDRHQAPLEFLYKPHLFQLFVLVLPGMLYFRVCYKLFTCPCGVRSLHAPRAEWRCARRLEWLGELIAYAIILAGIASLIWFHHQCSGGSAETTTDAPSTPWDTGPARLPQHNLLVTADAGVPTPFAPYHSCLSGIWQPVLKARVYGYLASWLLMVMVTFNPHFAFGQPDPTHEPIWIADQLGIGQWTIEKQRFQMHCMNAAVPLSTRLMGDH